MTITQEHIEKWKKRLEFKSEFTQNTYFVFCDSFLKQYDGNLDIDNVLDFLGNISKNSIRTAFYALKFFYKAAEVDFNLKVGDIAPSGIVKKIKPMLDTEEVAKLILGAKLHFGTVELGYVALSTIYGLRRIEMYNMKSSDIDVDNCRFKVFPVKHGVEERVHVIPPELVDVFGDLWYGLTKIKKKPVITTYNSLFDHICHKSGIELRPRLGWHSCRRALISRLQIAEPVINPNVIRHFMRWRPSSSDILLQYTILNPIEVDNRIFKQHPFIDFWRSDA